MLLYITEQWCTASDVVPIDRRPGIQTKGWWLVDQMEVFHFRPDTAAAQVRHDEKIMHDISRCWGRLPPR